MSIYRKAPSAVRRDPSESSSTGKAAWWWRPASQGTAIRSKRTPGSEKNANILLTWLRMRLNLQLSIESTRNERNRHATRKLFFQVQCGQWSHHFFTRRMVCEGRDHSAPKTIIFKGNELFGKWLCNRAAQKGLWMVLRRYITRYIAVIDVDTETSTILMAFRDASALMNRAFVQCV